MNRKLLGGLVFVAVAAFAVWFFAIRDKGRPSQPVAGGPTRSGEIAPPDPFATKEQPSAPTGPAPRWDEIDDREGPLVLEGQVVGPDGTPVAGAKVTLETRTRRTTTTDDAGAFSFDKLVGRTFNLEAESGDLVGSVVYKLTATSDPIVIRLGPSAAVAVTVVDEQTKPVVGAMVTDANEHRGTTDDKGTATLKPIAPGGILVRAKKEGFADAVGFTTAAAGGDPVALTIIMRKGFKVSGVVVDSDGKPLAGVKVVPTNANWGFGADSAFAPEETNAKGEFDVGPVAPGTHTLSARDGEHAPAQSALFTVADKPITGIKITMKAGAVLAGTVVTIDKKPAPFAVVRAAGTGANAWQEAARQTTADEKGAFELRGLPQIAMQARAEDDTAASKPVDVDLSAKSLLDLQLVLDVTGTIAGVVVDHTSTPIPEIQVNAFPDLLAGSGTEGLALAGLSSATTDAEGRFTIRGVPEGKYRLWAARGSQQGWGGWGNNSVPAQAGDTRVKIVLPAPGSLTAKIVLEGSTKVPAPAYLSVGPSTPSMAKDGVFTLSDVSAGTHDVEVRGPQFASQTRRAVKIEPGKTTDLGTITVFRGRTVTGKVVNKAGQPVAGAKVRVGDMLFSAEGQEQQMDSVSEQFGQRSAVTDQNGGFSIIGMSQKPTNIIAEHPEQGRSIAAQVPGGASDPPAVTLTLAGFGSVTGTITMGGKPVPRASISQSVKGGGASLSFVQSGEDGTYQLSKVPEGDIVIQVMRQQMMAMKSHSVGVKVTAGQQVRLDIDIPVGTIKLTTNLAPRAGATVNAAQVFLFEGAVVYATGKELNDAFGSGGAKGMNFWFGSPAPMPTFDELVPGPYSICAIPITGDMQDQTFTQRMGENIGTLAVYCKAHNVPATPDQQSVTVELPSMTPLPE